MQKDGTVKRRKVLQLGVLAMSGAMLAPARAQAKKVPKAQVQYQDAPKNGQECDACAQFVAPGGCKLVDGEIAPKGWCLLFVKKPS